MTPTSDKIFIKPLDKSVSGLIIPPKYQYKAKEFLSGRVLAKGKKANQVEVGDEVAYSKDLGVEVELDDQKIVVIKQGHIFAVV
jgi:co-chaperonin GroES (HSP10)